MSLNRNNQSDQWARHGSARRGAGTTMLLWLLSGGGVVVVVVAALFFIGGADQPVSNLAITHATRGPLTISIVESGTIQARNKTVLRSEVSGRVAIIQIIDEGTIITDKDVVLPDVEYTQEELAKKTPLVVLDDSQLKDDLVKQDINVQNAEAAWVQAQAALEVTRNQAKSDVETANLNLLLAKLDHEKYIAAEGEYANQLNAANSKITVAQQELEQAKEKWEWSKKLADQGIVTPTELETDRLNYEKSKIALSQAMNDKKLLEQYTHKRKIAELTNNVTQAERALERAKKKASADVIQAEATLRASKLEYDQLKEKLAFTRTQLKNCTIYAPRTGRVMYADSVSSSRWHRDEPLSEGTEVYERQPLILLSDDTEMMAKVKIHESMRTRVNIGMPVRIQSVELPGVLFTGKVAEIANSPDQASWWMNPDLRVYGTKINIDPSNVKLRTGMSCQAEIIVKVLKDVISVPLQCLVRVDGKPRVYVVGADGKQSPREVEVGLDNNRRVHIRSGLKEGEAVLLNPTLPTEAEGRPPHGEIPEVPQTQDDKKQPAKTNPFADLNPQKLKNMTPEQRRKLIQEKMKNLTPEQQKALRERRQSGRKRSHNPVPNAGQS